MPSPPPDTKRDDDRSLGELAHNMNSALAYVVTNLNLLTEGLESARLPASQRAKLLEAIDAAAEGADRLGAHVRSLKAVAWNGNDNPGIAALEGEDTWDEGEKAARILVIDDEPQILHAISRALKRYEVTTAESGQAALDLLKKGQTYDLILCDLIMRQLSGVDVYRWLQAHQPKHVDSLLFMTAGAFTTDLRDFLASVRNQVLHKPFDTKTLRWMVATKLRD